MKQPKVKEYQFKKDDAYKSLRLKFSEPNIFLVLDNANYEIRHSNFLKWVLDPNETHGHGDYFLVEFLKRIKCEFGETNKVHLKREHHGIDLLIWNESVAIAIENKTKTQDSDGQLRKYREVMEKDFSREKYQHHYIYWTVKGERPLDTKEAQHWKTYSHLDFVEVLATACGQLQNTKAKSYVQDYIDALQLNVLPESNYTALAKELVAKYRDEFNEAFTDTSDARSKRFESKFDRKDLRTLAFLERYSSFIRGNGFFSREKPFYEAFERACSSAGCYVIPLGPKQTTYFAFLPVHFQRTLFPAATKESIVFSFNFRFKPPDNLSFTFGVPKERTVNQDLRRIVLDNADEFHKRFPSQKPRGPVGAMDVGILTKAIVFDPMGVDAGKINHYVAEMFERDVNKFVADVSDLLKQILKKEGRFLSPI